MLSKVLFRYLLFMEPSCFDGTICLHGIGNFFWKVGKCVKSYFFIL
jgi:hypothetical protein